MIVATPVSCDGQTGHGWGRAHWVAVAEVRGPRIVSWQVHEVAWDETHDSAPHDEHHSRIERFLLKQRVEAVVVDHIGGGMRAMLAQLEIPILASTAGGARESVVAAVAQAEAGREPQHSRRD